jgi:hypothetical protein
MAHGHALEAHGHHEHATKKHTKAHCNKHPEHGKH